MVFSRVDGNPGSVPRATLENDSHFELKIHLDRRTKHGCWVVGAFALSVGAHDVGSAHRHGRGAAVVAYGQVQPVGQQRILGVAEHHSHIRSMLARCIKIGVVANVHGQQGLNGCGGLLAGASLRVGFPCGTFGI